MIEPTQHTRQAAGFTLVEILVSITILSVGILALGTLMVRGARSAGAASALTLQTTVLGAEAARFDAIPFTALAAGTTCDTVTTGQLYDRLTMLAELGNPLLQPDSVVFERSISGNATPPLNTP